MKNRIPKVFIILFMIGFVATGCSDNDVSARGAFYEKTAKNTVLGKTVNRTLMKVDKLTCGSCLSAISQKLNTFDGMVGLGADLGQALVAVDHTKALESSKIAEAITSIGYPAKILSMTEIDSKKAFISQNTRQNGGGCCGSAGFANTATLGNENGPGFSSKENSYSSGCPYVGSVRSRGCYASSASWKELMKRFSENRGERKETE